MTQRKLTDDELQKVMTARHDIRYMCNWDETEHGRYYWHGVSKQLDLMADHATTDGRPWVDPAPPIPDGYRKAVAGDQGRADVKILAKQSNEWIDRPYKNMGFCVGDTYIVPADIAPTDEEAAVTPRIKVMVRNFSTDLWQKKTLFAVSSTTNEVLRFVTDGGSWIFCRYPYQGE